MWTGSDRPPPQASRGTRPIWAGQQRLDLIVLVFADLLNAVGEPAAALEIVQRLYDSWPAGERRSGDFGLAIDALANLNSQSGNLDRAVALFQEALFDPANSEEQHVGIANRPPCGSASTYRQTAPRSSPTLAGSVSRASCRSGLARPFAPARMWHGRAAASSSAPTRGRARCVGEHPA
jgi:hypothetical protein